MALALAGENIFAWNGSFYAQSASERMGVEESGGWLRLGLVHYNTVAEVDRCVRVLEALRVSDYLCTFKFGQDAHIHRGPIQTNR